MASHSALACFFQRFSYPFVTLGVFVLGFGRYEGRKDKNVGSSLADDAFETFEMLVAADDQFRGSNRRVDGLRSARLRVARRGKKSRVDRRLKSPDQILTGAFGECTIFHVV